VSITNDKQNYQAVNLPLRVSFCVCNCDLRRALRFLRSFTNVLPTPEDEKKDEPRQYHCRGYSQPSDNCGVERLVPWIWAARRRRGCAFVRPLAKLSVVRVTYMLASILRQVLYFR
jgi:hypothetical protein